MKMLSAVDDFVLDRLLQPMMDAVHQQWGWTIQAVARWSIHVRVLGFLTFYGSKFQAGHMETPDWIVCFGMLMFALVDMNMPFTPSSTTTLPRERLSPRDICVRFVMTGFVLYALIRDVLPHTAPLPSYLGFTLWVVSTWVYFCLRALRSPPPRKLRKPVPGEIYYFDWMGSTS
jgi:hypothetical protein